MAAEYVLIAKHKYDAISKINDNVHKTTSGLHVPVLSADNFVDVQKTPTSRTPQTDIKPTISTDDNSHHHHDNDGMAPSSTSSR